MYPRQEARKLFWSEHDRETYTCPECGRGIEEVTQFQVHHKDENRRNNDLDNLVGLCRRCHHDLHGWWTRYYRREGINEIERRYLRVLE